MIWVAAAAWSFASPMGSGPDEPAHLIRAASLVRGELLGTPLADTVSATKAYVTVEAPQVFARLENDVVCFRYKPPSVPASCQGTLDGSSSEVHVDIYVGRYSPLYYSLVGLPTLVAVNPAGMYLARLASGALSAAMLALAVVSLRRCRGAPLLAAGLALAMTPMVLYLAGVVNPSGLEISSAISAWVAVMALTSEPSETVPASVVGALGISTIVLMLTRGLSPLWVSFIGLGLVALVGRRRRELLPRRCVKGWLAGCLAAAGVALGWDLYADPFLIVPASAVPRWNRHVPTVRAHFGPTRPARDILDRRLRLAGHTLALRRHRHVASGPGGCCPGRHLCGSAPRGGGGSRHRDRMGCRADLADRVAGSL